MADNPFSVSVVNPLQALLIGQQAYSTAQEGQKQQALTDARAQAGQLYQAGDTKGALARLLSGGDLQGAGTYSTLDNNAWTRQHTTERDASTDRHQAFTENLALRAANRADEGPVEQAGYRAQVAQKYGIDPNTPEGRAFVVSGKLPDTLSGGGEVGAASQRAQVARQYGIDPATPEGKSFILTGKLPVPPDGFTKQTDGSLAPIPGGTTDPAYLARVDAAKATARGDVPTIIGPGSSVIVPNKAADGPVFTNKISGGGLSQDALDIRAAQWNNGDYEGATKNVGRGAQGGATLEAIANRAAEKLIEGGATPEQAAAATSQNMQRFRASGIYQNTESRTGASREANLNIILKATDAAIPAALEASEKVSRTGFVPLNKIIQSGKVMTSDPDLRAFGMANLQLAEHWARAMNPTGVMRESDRDMALHYLSLADTKETYKSSVMQLKTQITRERDAIRSASGQGNSQPSAPAAGAYVWTPDAGLVSK